MNDCKISPWSSRSLTDYHRRRRRRHHRHRRGNRVLYGSEDYARNDPVRSVVIARWQLLFCGHHQYWSNETEKAWFWFPVSTRGTGLNLQNGDEAWPTELNDELPTLVYLADILSEVTIIARSGGDGVKRKKVDPCIFCFWHAEENGIHHRFC